MTIRSANRPRLLIDADTYLYRAAYASEQVVSFDPDILYVQSDLSLAKAMFTASIESLRKRFRTDDIVIAFTDSTNWRHRYHATYKANRVKGRKPVGFKAVKDWAMTEFKCTQVFGLEADDVIGIMATEPGVDNQIIISIDKDLRTIPARVFNPDKDSVPMKITTEEADYNHMYQALVGDRVDNYEGCPGVGPVKARKALDDRKGSLWEAVKGVFAKAGKGEGEAFANVAASRILRFGDMNLKTLELTWRPE